MVASLNVVIVVCTGYMSCAGSGITMVAGNMFFGHNSSQTYCVYVLGLHVVGGVGSPNTEQVSIR